MLDRISSGHASKLWDRLIQQDVDPACACKLLQIVWLTVLRITRETLKRIWPALVCLVSKDVWVALSCFRIYLCVDTYTAVSITSS